MIKIKNIYYMLAYAFRALEKSGYAFTEHEAFDSVPDLFAAILTLGLNEQIKRGLYRNYMGHTDLLVSPVGKIYLAESVKKQAIMQKKLICSFDEFSENTYLNQILKTTALLLLRFPSIEASRKTALKKTLYHFSRVNKIDADKIEWSNIKYQKNNTAYKMLIYICYLVVEGMLQNDHQGRKKISNYLDDQRMSALYERFVFSYCKKHYPDLKPKQQTHIRWNIDEGFDTGSMQFLPIMKSDIMLQDTSKTLIIDTKYYTKTMQVNFHSNKSMLFSSHLYQIFSYVKNRDTQGLGNVDGLLLYAKTDEAMVPDSRFLMGKNEIHAQSLDLNVDFQSICSQLDTLINYFFPFALKRTLGFNHEVQF